jgi:hypothetical protein
MGILVSGSSSSIYDDSDNDPNYSNSSSESLQPIGSDSDLDDDYICGTPQAECSTLSRPFTSLSDPSTSTQTFVSCPAAPSTPQAECSTLSRPFTSLPDPSTSTQTSVSCPAAPSEILVNNNSSTDNINIWKDPTGSGRQFSFNGNSGINPNVTSCLANGTVFDSYKHFIGDDLLDTFVSETNIYASQILTNRRASPKSRVVNWKPTDRNEILNFLGIICYMGIVRMPQISDYWTTDIYFRNSIIPTIMSRNRFELLLRMLHFSNNENCPENDRLFKIQPVAQYLITKFQETYTPGEVVCVDETIVPFKGRLIMKQYAPQKAHKYGVKIFKVSFGQGYTWNLNIYSGKTLDKGNSIPTNVVMKLCEPLFHAGRIIVTDNYYTSLDLATRLLEKSTNLLGTLRANRKGNPKDVISRKLKRGELIAKQNEKGVTVMKWCDKRDILILSTLHGSETVSVQRRNKEIYKPKAIMDYNVGKSSIDLSDQLSSYCTPLRRSLKWYRKVAIELLLGTTVVNSHIIYKKVSGKNIKITDYRKELAKSMMTYGKDDTQSHVQNEPYVARPVKKALHVFAKMDGYARQGRKYCRGCYDKKIRGEIEKNKVKKVITYCKDCTGEPRYCLQCFTVAHK